MIKCIQYLCVCYIIITAITTTVIAQNKAYKGAEVDGSSQFNVTYGKIEVRMMAAKGSGILSTMFTWKEGSEQSGAFWEEIDIEVFGKNNAATWQSNIISGNNPRKTSEQVHNQGLSLADNFHTYSIEWTPDYVAWFIDGRQIRKTLGGQAADLKSPAGIRFNLWVSSSASWVGQFDDSVLPQFQFINWIKYYKYDNGKFTLDWTDDFDSFNTNHWSTANWTFDGNLVDFDPQNAVVQDGMLILCLTKAGETGFDGTVPLDSENVNTGVTNRKTLPENYCLMQNYPNPFNPETVIGYQLPVTSHVELSIYDVLGREVTTLVNKEQNAGKYEVKFSAGSFGDGSNLTSGIYFYRIKAGDFVQTKKMILVK